MTLTSPSLPQAGLSAPRDARTAHGSSPRYLFSPAVDFACLGGGSLLLFVPIMFLDVPTFEPVVAATILFIAHFLNSPHFAHSYQIFYRNFGAKAFGDAYSPQLRARYIIAGIVAPIALIGFFAAAVLSDNARVLGFGFNIMLFLVGWHYVKQGYGMIIVDSVLKGNFFAEREKQVLICNAYLCWFLSWGALNNAVASRDMYGLTAYSIPVPQVVILLLGAAIAVTTALSAVAIFRRWQANTPFPWNGVVAYAVTLYLWVLLPSLAAPAAFVVLMAIATPAAHSLQYLVVVWRYQSNVERAKPATDHFLAPMRKPAVRLGYFILLGIAIGFFGFWVLPTAFDVFSTYDRSVFGKQMFLFMFAIFINVHHYFLDNVMWRRENPDVRRHLFGAS